MVRWRTDGRAPARAVLRWAHAVCSLPNTTPGVTDLFLTARRSPLQARRRFTIDQTLANRLLAALPRVERQSLLAHCEYVELTAPLPLQEGHGRLRHAYFPVDSTISVLAPADKRRSLEIGAVGCEGLFGPESRIGGGVVRAQGLDPGFGPCLAGGRGARCSTWPRATKA